MKIQLENFVVNKLNTQNRLAHNDKNFNIIYPEYFFTKDVFITINSHIKIIHNFKYTCVGCLKDVKKFYSGFCYVCFTKKPEADICIVSPSRCHFLQGTCRSEEFGKEFCYQPHYLYLAFTDKYKVGLTRHTQVPTRWIDQGATIASPFLKVHSRHQAGILEDFLKQKLADKSNWRNMLKSLNNSPSYEEFSEELQQTKCWLQEHPVWNEEKLRVKNPQHLNLESQISIVSDTQITKISYPLSDKIPEKFTSIRLEKTPEISGTVVGIKGQYIMLDNGTVINLRNHSGYIVDIEIDW